MEANKSRMGRQCVSYMTIVFSDVRDGRLQEFLGNAEHEEWKFKFSDERILAFYLRSS